MPRSYIDLEIELCGERIRARSPFGDTQDIRWDPSGLPSCDRLPLRTADEAKVVGHRLFGALFHPAIRELYRFTLAEVRLRDSAEIRLRLIIHSPHLARLPWEYLYNADAKTFVCLQHPMVRHPPVQGPAHLPRPRSPLRILAMLASPRDKPIPNAGRERDAVDAAITPLRRAGTVEFTWLEQGTARALQEQAQSTQYHAFHFIGHGEFDVATSTCSLIVEDESTGLAARLPVERLPYLLGSSDVRLVVLNCCQGAMGSHASVFSSGAATLVQQGILAVVAMQRDVRHDDAKDFAELFYTAISRGMAVDSAVTEARAAMFTRSSEGTSWGTPSLFVRTADRTALDFSEVSRGLRDPYAVARQTVLTKSRVIQGRGWALGQLRKLRERSAPGVVGVFGPPGAGKTTLLGHIADAERCPAFFFGGGSNPHLADCAASLLLQFGKTGDVPFHEHDRCRLLQHRIFEASTGSGTLLVLDAIDEARGGSGAIAGLLPFDWPTGLVVVVSSRSENAWRSFIAALPPGLTVCELDLGPGNPLVCEDAVEIAAARVGDRARARELAASLAYNPLLIFLSTGSVPGQTGRLSPEFSMVSFYERCWTAITRDLDPSEMTGVIEVAGLLITAREPVSALEVSTAARCGGVAVEAALLRLSSCLEVVPGSNDTRYRLFHETFRDWLRGRIGSQQRGWHAQWAALSKHTAPEEPEAVRRYGIRHGIAHCIQGGALDQAFELGTDFGFLLRRVAHGCLDAHVRDLEEACARLGSSDPRATALSAWHQFLRAEGNLARRFGADAIVQRALEQRRRQEIADAAARWRDGCDRDREAALDTCVAEEADETIMLLYGSMGAVEALEVLSGGARAVSGGEDGLSLWDMKTGSRLRQAAVGRVRCLWTDNGAGVVWAGLADGGLVRWQLADDTLRRSMTRHEGQVTAITVDAEHGLVVSGGSDGTLRAWRAEDLGEVSKLAGHSSRVHCIATLGGRRFLSGSWDRTTLVWDLDSGERAPPMGFPAGPLLAVATDPTDNRLALAVGRGASRLCFWDEAHDETVVLEGVAEITTLAARSGDVLAGCADGQILWVPEGAEAPVRIGRAMGEARVVAIQGDGRLIFGGEDGPLHVVGGPRGPRAASPAPEQLADLELLDSCVVSAYRTGQVEVRHLARPDDVVSFSGHSGGVACLIALPDQQRFVTAGRDATVRVWSREGERAVYATAAPVEALIPLAGGQLVAAYMRTPPGLLVIDMKTGDLRGLEAPPGVHALHASDVQACVAALAWNGTLMYHDLARGVTRCASDHRLIHGTTIATLDNGEVAVGTSDGKVLVVANDGEVRAMHDLHEMEVVALAPLPRGRVASGSADGTVGVVDARRILWTRRADPVPCDAAIRGLVVDTRDRLFALQRRTAVRLDPGSGRVLAEVRITRAEDDEGAEMIAVEVHGRTLVVAVSDGTIRWFGPDGRESGVWYGHHLCPVMRVASDTTIVAGERSGRIHVIHRSKRTPSELDSR